MWYNLHLPKHNYNFLFIELKELKQMNKPKTFPKPEASNWSWEVNKNIEEQAFVLIREKL